MTFQYYDGELAGLGYQQENPYVVEQPQQQQQPMGGMGGMGFNPQMLQMFQGGGQAAAPAAGGGAAPAVAGGGGAAATTGGAATGGAAAGGATGGAAGGGAGGAGAGGMLANPWVWLAAVIIGNEYGASEAGRRREGSDYAKDLIGGKVLEQDAPYYSKKIFGDDKFGFGAEMEAGGDFMTLDFSNALDSLKSGVLGKALGLD